MSRLSKKGMVSITVVMFTSLLLIVVSVGFIRIMSQEENRASDNNLSQSAYDSAVSGVEDAKRVITACNNGSAQACAAIGNRQCNTVQAAGIVASVTDTKVSIRSNGMPQDERGQSYTCVMISSRTDDVKYTLEEGVSEVIPLTSTADSRYVKVQWTLRGEDMTEIRSPNDWDAAHLPRKDAWGVNAPALLRVQLVVPQSGTITQGEFDSNQVVTVFLRPNAVVEKIPSRNTVVLDVARAANSEDNVTVNPRPIACSAAEFNANQYACSAYLDLGDSRLVRAGSKMAYMRVTSLYTRTQFRASFQDTSDATVAQFDGVQPIVDSTGRTGDVYRRVLSRVSPDRSFDFPEYAVDITGSLCKDFSVTGESVQAGTCATAPSS